MRRRGEIWLCDLVDVLDRLDVRNERTLAHVVKALDIRLAGGVATAQESRPSDEPENEPVDGSATNIAWELALETLEVPLVREPDEYHEPPEIAPVAHRPWSDESDYLEAALLDPVDCRHAGTPAEHPSLLKPAGVRPILSAALATRGTGGEIDVDALVSTLAEGRPVTRVPYRPRPSLFLGARVLVDLGPGMQPFHRDQTDMITQLRELVGRDLVEVHWYEDSPLRGCGDGPVGSWPPFVPPHRGTPVLVLGDLGIGAPSPKIERDWLALSEQLAHRESRLVALVPYAQSRWPPSLRDALEMIVWDRSTSIADITFRLRR